MSLVKIRQDRNPTDPQNNANAMLNMDIYVKYTIVGRMPTRFIFVERNHKEYTKK